MIKELGLGGRIRANENFCPSFPGYAVHQGLEASSVSLFHGRSVPPSYPLLPSNMWVSIAKENSEGQKNQSMCSMLIGLEFPVFYWTADDRHTHMVNLSLCICCVTRKRYIERCIFNSQEWPVKTDLALESSDEKSGVLLKKHFLCWLVCSLPSVLFPPGPANHAPVSCLTHLLSHSWLSLRPVPSQDTLYLSVTCELALHRG